ncbi:MAG: polysaccharide export protein, partial [Candidatus Omnitrophica bacterium]|nr:polysaccharide export protein [Candidatus Omnitrophota bacterium]
MKTKRMILMMAALMLGVAARCAWASELEIVEDVSVTQPVQEETDVPENAISGAAKAEVAPQAAPQPSESLIVRADEPTAGAAVPSTKTMPAPAPVAKTDEPTRYTLGPDDIIEIIVRRHSEFSGQYPINSEGKIQYKFVGDIEIRGLTKTEVKDRIAQILSRFIINPDVDVTIVEYRSKVIYVIGEVGAPGKYYMKADKISLREAVVQAGLPTLSAAMRRTQLVRPDKSGKPKEMTVDLYALLYEGKLNLDQEMFPGDVLVVPATLFAKIARIINPIAQPV